MVASIHESFPVINVRTVGVEDWQLWRDLRLEALQEAPHAFGSTLAEWQGEGDTEMRWRARLSTVRLNVVAYLNGKAAGMVSGTSANQHGIVELISMWVAPFARRQGVGDSLVVTVIEWTRGQRAAKNRLGRGREQPARAEPLPPASICRRRSY